MIKAAIASIATVMLAAFCCLLLSLTTCIAKFSYLTTGGVVKL